MRAAEKTGARTGERQEMETGDHGHGNVCRCQRKSSTQQATKMEDNEGSPKQKLSHLARSIFKSFCACTTWSFRKMDVLLVFFELINPPCPSSDTPKNHQTSMNSSSHISTSLKKCRAGIPIVSMGMTQDPI